MYMNSNTSEYAPTITVLGAGYVGLTTATLLACAGYKVYIVEPNPERLETIKSGRSFFFEKGIDVLIKEGLESGSLLPTASYEESVPNSQVVFSCVGTPDNADGSSNLEYVFSAATSVAKLAKPGTIFVQKSTVPVGTATSIIALFKEYKANLQYVSNPEFLREGTAIQDTLYFDRIVMGGDPKATNVVQQLYTQLELQRDEISKKASIPAGFTDGEYIQTSLESAELTKVTSNAFLALKISFANSIAQLADATGANITEVMDAVGSDKRIGRAFLDAGRGYGGGCFPKDVSGLIVSSEQFGVELGIMREVQRVNEAMPAYIINKAIKATGNNLAGKRIAVLGLAFKPGTSDTRRSPGIKIANLLVKRGAKVHAYDPQANQEARHDLDSPVILEDTLSAALDGSEIVLIATAWEEFAGIDFNSIQDRRLTVVDAVNMLDPSNYADTIQYIGVGR